MASTVGYGTHPTIYGSYSDEALMDLYRESSWFCMGEDSRQQLLQETVNRSAAAKGELGACEVRFADLDSGTLGEQSGNVININRSVFAQDTYQHEYNGHMIEERAFDSNMRALETVLHEDIHAWQNQCIDGTISCPDATLLEEYTANNFSISVVPDGYGGLQIGSHYLSGETPNTGYYMYYFQSTERDAHLYSEQQTWNVMQSLQAKYGDDKSLLTYQKGVLLNGYQTTYREGQLLFGNENFEQEINQVLVNQYYKTNTPVDPAIQAAVQNEMIASYEAQMRASVENKEDIVMDKGYTPVTAEDYESSMRSTVNAFYEHAVNDPSLTQEEAIAQTAEVAENYLAAMEDVQAAGERGEIAARKKAQYRTEEPDRPRSAEATETTVSENHMSGEAHPGRNYDELIGRIRRIVGDAGCDTGQRIDDLTTRVEVLETSSDTRLTQTERILSRLMSDVPVTEGQEESAAEEIDPEKTNSEGFDQAEQDEEDMPGAEQTDDEEEA